MRIKKYPSQEELRRLFDYGEESFERAGLQFIGGLVWRRRFDSQGRPNTREFGQYAGFVDSGMSGLQAQIHGQRYELHRLVWIWHFGDVESLIDHRNRDRKDNRIGNLRQANHSDNNANRTKKANCSSEYVGVYLNVRGKWSAQIKKNGIVKHLGSFPTQEAAAAARDEATKALHKEFGVLNHVGN